jgi:hypothetical protein
MSRTINSVISFLPRGRAPHERTGASLFIPCKHSICTSQIHHCARSWRHKRVTIDVLMGIERDTKVVQPLLESAIPASPSTNEEGQQAIQGEGWNRGMLEHFDNGCCYMAHLVASRLGEGSDGERPHFIRRLIRVSWRGSTCLMPSYCPEVKVRSDCRESFHDRNLSHPRPMIQDDSKLYVAGVD